MFFFWLLVFFFFLCIKRYSSYSSNLPYFQILRLFSESTQSIGVLKGDLAEAKKLLGARNKQLHQLWYRSVTLRHIISLLDQIEGIAKVSCLRLFFYKRCYYYSCLVPANQVGIVVGGPTELSEKGNLVCATFLASTLSILRMNRCILALKLMFKLLVTKKNV